jgi:hypothetical protein
MFGGWPSPHPGLGAAIELGGGHPPCFIQVSGPTAILPCHPFPPQESRRSPPPRSAEPALVGMKTGWTRGCAASQSRMGGLW